MQCEDVNVGDIIFTFDSAGIVTEIKENTILFNDDEHDYICDICDISDVIKHWKEVKL